MEENKRSVENGLEENIEIKADEQNAAPIKEDFDEFKISDGFVIYEEPEKPAPVNKKKKKEKGPVIWIISIILVAFMIAFGIIFRGCRLSGYWLRERLGRMRNNGIFRCDDRSDS